MRFTRINKDDPASDIRVAHFDSVSAMLAHANDERNLAKINKARWKVLRERETESAAWTNYYSFKRAVKELSEPPAAAVDVSEIVSDIASRFDAMKPVRRRLRRQEYGDALDPEAWIRRDPDGWERTEKRMESRGVIRVACNPSCGGGSSPEHVKYRGAAAVALADALESSGYSVELAMTCASHKYYTNNERAIVCLETVMKHAHMPLDIDTVSLVLGEIGFFRTAIFVCEMACASQQVSSNLGSAATLPMAIAEQYDIILDSNVRNLDSALKVIKRYVDRVELG